MYLLPAPCTHKLHCSVASYRARPHLLTHDRLGTASAHRLYFGRILWNGLPPHVRQGMRADLGDCACVISRVRERTQRTERVAPARRLPDCGSTYRYPAAVDASDALRHLAGCKISPYGRYPCRTLFNPAPLKSTLATPRGKTISARIVMLWHRSPPNLRFNSSRSAASM